MLEFADILYSRISLPDWISPFLRIPEFIRLRGVRLSNVDSFEFKDFSGPNRWDHGVAVAALADRCARKAGLSQTQSAQLILASLLHDVATPPFAHTAEYVLENFDHELETQRLLTSSYSEHTSPSAPIYVSELPAFRNACLQLGKRLRVSIDPDEIAAMITGGGELGFLVSGTLDLDNADNVTRSSLYLGLKVDGRVPLQIADWLATQSAAPIDLEQVNEGAVKEWLGYRSEMYRMFFEATEQEAGRQAFLQHLIRRALRTQVPRGELLWNTDDGLLRVISELDDRDQQAASSAWPSLRELVQRYRLMEVTHKIAEIDISDTEMLRALRVPQAATWIERQLSTKDLEPFVMVSARRFGGVSTSDLLPPAVGMLTVFKLGSPPKYLHFPEWLRSEMARPIEGKRLLVAVDEALRRKVGGWVKERPWLIRSPARDRSAVQNLTAIGDWSFRLSKNEAVHAYPGTYVHAIPSSLIHALGLKGATVWDPFGGTGQTAVEVVKTRGIAISADSNAVATLVAKTKLTYLTPQQRRILVGIRPEEIRNAPLEQAPAAALIAKWHHPRTLQELRKIKGFISSQRDPLLQQFLLACFSAVLPGTTGRRGKEHGFFADNTPLASGEKAPPYHDAVEIFCAKVLRNVEVIGRLYASIEANGCRPEEELGRAAVFHADARFARASDFGIEAHSVDAVITSPPYLCMADYSLGQRLSYYWLFPDQLEADFSHEIGSRRQRFRASEARDRYLHDLELVAENAASLIRKGGYFAAVLGAPVAAAFANSGDLHEAFDALMAKSGFSRMWIHWRDIHWHRNHGYQRLRQERISVHVAG